MINYELLKDVLTIAILNSLIITSLVQRIKESVVIKCSRICIIVSFITSLIIGTLFSLSFSNLKFFPSLWSSIISFLGADFIYKLLDNKIFKSLGDINNER